MLYTVFASIFVCAVCVLSLRMNPQVCDSLFYILCNLCAHLSGNVMHWFSGSMRLSTAFAAASASAVATMCSSTDATLPPTLTFETALSITMAQQVKMVFVSVCV